MRFYFNLCLFLFFSLWMFVLINELYTDLNLEVLLKKPNKGLPENSEVYKIANSDNKFENSQTKALIKREKRIVSEILSISMVTLTSIMFLDLVIRSKIFKIIQNITGYVPKFRNNVRYHEVSFVSLFCTLFTMSIFGFSLSNTIFNNTNKSIVPSICIYIILMLSIFPFLYLIIKKLFRLYGYRFIIACYIAYFAKAISEFLSMDDVDLENMQPVNINNFGPEVQNFLKEKHLENKVYSEKKISESLNAALVGWGFFERIEIYGDYTKLDKKEFESILLHEIGHSKDYSLVKKIMVLFLIKAVEMGIMLYLFSTITKSYCDTLMGQESSFFILYLIYKVFIYRWIMSLHKLTSQYSEQQADQIAKNFNYGHPLAKVLYDITVTGNQSLRATFLYNALKSYHPSVYDRIEHLSS